MVSGKVWEGFYYQGRDEAGRRVQIPLGTDLNEAKRKWVALEAKPAPAPTGLMSSVFDRYVRDVIPTKAPSTQRDNLSCIKMLRPAFDSAPVDSLLPRQVAAYRDARGAKAPVRANREISLLGHVFKMAREWGYTAKPNPVTGIGKLKEHPRDYYLAGDVWAALYAAAVPELKDALDLAYLSGQRPGDVLRMKLSDIRDGALEVRQGKTKMKLRIMLDLDGGKTRTELGMLIDRIRERPVTGIGGSLLATPEGKALTAPMLRVRFEDAREGAALKAEENQDMDLAGRIRQAQFRDVRPKAASEIATVQGASDLLGHTQQEITRKVYIRKGKEVLPVR